jgi:hypothetical protein
MTRREAFVTAAAAIVAAVVPVATGEPLHEIHRYSYETDSWTRCRMFELRDGDVFRLGTVGIFLAEGNPWKGEDGIWVIGGRRRIDEETNQWVPA